MTIISGDIARESKGVIEIFTTDNTVLISRISALFNAENIDFMVLGNHASLLGGGIAGIGQRMMVGAENTQKALRLIRQTGLQDDIDIVKGLENSG